MDIYELLKMLGTNAMKQYAGAGEAALSTGTGIISGAAAPIGGAIAALQNNGANPYEQEIMNFMQRNTYAPRTEVGQQRVEQIGEFANRNLVPIAPMLEGLALPLTAGSRTRYNPTAARATLEQIVPDYVAGGNISKAANSNDVVAAMMNDPQLQGFAEYFKQNYGKPVDTIVPYKEANRVPQEAVAVDNGLLQANAEKQLASNNARGYTREAIAKAQQEYDRTGKLPEGYVASKEDGVLYPKPESLLGKAAPADKFLEDANKNFDKYTQLYQTFNDPKSHHFTDGGRIINTDSFREVFPVYREDRTKSALVHEGASELAKQWYAKKLSEPVPAGYENRVLFTAGGTGAGKTSAMDSNPILKPIADTANIIYDTNMNGLQSSIKKIEQALDAGREVDIVYTYRDPEEALRLGALTRAMNMKRKTGSGRTVPLNEHLKTHMGSYDTMLKLQEMYKDDPRVIIRALDNSHGKGKSRVVTLDKIPKINENEVSPRLTRALEEEYQSGRISKDVYEGTKVQ